MKRLALLFGLFVAVSFSAFADLYFLGEAKDGREICYWIVDETAEYTSVYFSYTRYNGEISDTYDYPQKKESDGWRAYKNPQYTEYVIQKIDERYYSVNMEELFGRVELRQISEKEAGHYFR